MTASGSCSAQLEAAAVSNSEGGLICDFADCLIADSFDRRDSSLGIQPKLGLLPVWNDRSDSDHSDHHDDARPILTVNTRSHGT
jgi:hypothetical protein